ncbi:MAG: DMT family transporter [Desulfobacter sp.]|nr:MAG: DMT family transporter [Desulfobacter sp.]
MEKTSPFPLAPRIAGPLFMIGAALLFTLMSVLVKLLPGTYSVWHIGFVRFSGGLVLILLLFSNKGNPFKGHNIPLLIFRGCTGTMAFLTVVAAMRILPLSTASILFYCYPVFAAFFGFMVYRERINTGQLLCMVSLVAGVGVLFDFGITGSMFGQAMAVASALFAGFTVTLIRSLREHNGVVVIYLYFCAAGTVVTLFPCIADPVLPATPMEWIMLGTIAVSSLGAQLMMNQGFFFCRGFEGGVYMSTETVFTAMVGIFMLNDPVSWQFFLGAFLILGSGLALNRFSS